MIFSIWHFFESKQERVARQKKERLEASQAHFRKTVREFVDGEARKQADLIINRIEAEELELASAPDTEWESDYHPHPKQDVA